MQLPTSGGHKSLRSVVSAKTSTYTITRPSHTSGAMGGTETETTHDAQLWVGSPQEIAEDTEYGERLTGGLAGLSLPTEDVEEGDQLEYQSVPYEVEEVIVSDSDTGDTLKVLNLVRRQNT